MSENKIKCPACGKECGILSSQPPEPMDTTTAVSYTYSMQYNVTYAATVKNYKCVNPECWVTKVVISWS